jgi:N-acetylmuramoyl-L-alanine amidase
VPPVDTSLLAGRTIVLDPGHGCGFTGAVGKGGIQEADVNMRVSLYLSDMLRKYGAKTLLTRVGDRGFSTGSGVEVRENLKSRVELANFVEADLFLSIHHNSSLYRGDSYNAVETYYKLGDEGPSLDAARSIHRHLAENLGISENYLLPGNYYILRVSDRPTILGEASYISNSSMADKLKKKEKLYLEAQAYLLGILDYFSRGRPLIRPLFNTEETVYSSMPVLEAVLTPGQDGAPVDVSSVYLVHDGDRVTRSNYWFDGERFKYSPANPLSSGIHRFELNVRNLKGNSAIPLRFTLNVILSATMIEVKVSPKDIPAGDRSLVLVEAFVRDETGGPVVDGKEVEFRIRGSRRETRIKRTVGGRASLLQTASTAGKSLITVRCDGIEVEQSLNVGKTDDAHIIIRLRDGRTDEPIAGASVTLSNGEKTQKSLTSPEGYTFFSTFSEGLCTLNTHKMGYHRYIEEMDVKRGKVTRVDLGLNPVQGGLLDGKLIVIDADHYRPEDPLVRGFRLSDLNLMMADHLSNLLEASGSEVLMMRRGDIPLTPMHRVVKSSESPANVHIIVRHAPTEKGRLVQVSHFPGSKSGSRLAGLLNEEISILSEGRVTVWEEASTVMRHTPSPTVAVNARIPRESTDPGVSVDFFIRHEAYAVYNALLRYFGTTTEDRFELRGIILDENGSPIRDALVTLDGFLTMRTGNGGAFRFRLLEGGYHLLSSVAGGYIEKVSDVYIGTGEPDNIRIIMEHTTVDISLPEENNFQL